MRFASVLLTLGWAAALRATSPSKVVFSQLTQIIVRDYDRGPSD